VVDFGDLEVSQINALITNIESSKSRLKAQIKQLSFKEKKGLIVESFRAQTLVKISNLGFAIIHQLRNTVLCSL